MKITKSGKNMFIEFNCLGCLEKYRIQVDGKQKEDYLEDPDNYKKIFPFHKSDYGWFEHELCKDCIEECDVNVIVKNNK